MTPDIALTTAELLEVLGDGVTARQLWSVSSLAHSSRPTTKGVSLMWPAAIVPRLQVAVALQGAVAPLFRGPGRSPFPALLEAVTASPEPSPRCWAVYRDGEVSYVLYSADLFRATGAGAVVAEIKSLWLGDPPATPEEGDQPT